MSRREYKISIVINDQRFSKLIIDSHYQEKHADYMNDELILELVKTLDGEEHEPETEDPPFPYYTKDRIKIGGKFYKLVWLFEEEQIYVGVINAYRR